jgi:hypothetical protein
LRASRPLSRYAHLTRDQLATLVPELLLIGQLIDRSGMAWCISAFGREEMAQVAVEEWAASSPLQRPLAVRDHEHRVLFEPPTELGMLQQVLHHLRVQDVGGELPVRARHGEGRLKSSDSRSMS